MDQTLEQLKKNGWQISQESWQCLTPYGKKFAEKELGRTKEYYGAHLRQLGFTRFEHVLDAGCGLGQWSVGLAELNQRVTAIDIDTSRLLLAREITAPYAYSNLEIRNGPTEQLPLPDGICDAVFCCIVFTFVDMRRSIREFARVLRPGGTLYLNANALGYWLHLLLNEGVRSGNYRALAAPMRSLFKTVCGSSTQRIVTQRWLRTLVNEAGFDIQSFGPEGSINVDPQKIPHAPPLYPERYYGCTTIWELLAVKRGM